MDPMNSTCDQILSMPFARTARAHSCRAASACTDIAGIFPTEASNYRPVGALLLEQTDERALRRRYMSPGTLAEVGDNPDVSLSAVGA
jgi:hypothetical protein